ncbi:hypothetical protein A2X44_03150 [candidate division CPR3 bacterium GWF2_35_18]|uniref:Uncharacterized protein n=1 Tax=candidate division CPR3 bacterium GW2011_GWF2_35_18 TaxID=1618350 RepID=A0A0G0BJ75_UNCC3|nr:MAG: hypothetical protein UR67_C0006G0070 [candidate division CPR3 bacterium GW2011_GWF2_35_18]OGB62975.1 MAG: hypothetical protein A2X44_03150 [candidate division CPR3 bacterium GWF2_35_18]OGB65899.1 MAG: hypothetical protein A2250_03240 [candidate division CPR3 bacterium RIFOXYA2_FULL_35_13]OGB76727.1 MAG: hypothetical protein A2476_00440 [candidate division CPR3 bacterium RIFOXYC2_FULL_35_7]OGB78928.1 MAG: hypothetical protein A2296_00050 [candidate division CPR3 bacterium RIFOXYB2_FULL_3
MENIEEKLQKLPKVKPTDDFVNHLQETLVEKHILLSKKEKSKSFGVLPIYALGGFLALIIIIYSSVIYRNYNLSTVNKNTVSTVSDLNREFQPQQGENTSNLDTSTKSASSSVNQNVSGFLVVSNLNSELYELRNKGEITNYISGDSNFLKLFVNKEVVVKGYLEGSFDNINIIKTAEIELK